MEIEAKYADERSYAKEDQFVTLGTFLLEAKHELATLTAELTTVKQSANTRTDDLGLGSVELDHLKLKKKSVKGKVKFLQKQYNKIKAELAYESASDSSSSEEEASSNEDGSVV